ncbi:MAG TPA: hypothetical protein VJ867_04325 [Gemmatimonadaceae bacterium]|nr:hypothetical protein [Gemmatimonadaceae bacterium]
MHDDDVPASYKQELMRAGLILGGMVGIGGAFLGKKDTEARYWLHVSALGAAVGFGVGAATGVHFKADPRGQYLPELAIDVAIGLLAGEAAIASRSGAPLIIALPLQVLIPTLFEAQAYRRALAAY